jgi:hypothetical protein
VASGDLDRESVGPSAGRTVRRFVDGHAPSVSFICERLTHNSQQLRGEIQRWYLTVITLCREKFFNTGFRAASTDR